jgi:hypothetical protein
MDEVFWVMERFPMINHRDNEVSDHSGASDGSASLCDHIYNLLIAEIPDLRRKMVKRWCCFYCEGKNRFAYVTHRKRSVRLEVWFASSPDLKLRFPELDVRPRSETSGGWKGFDSRFYVDTELQAKEAANLLILTSKSGETHLDKHSSIFPDEVTKEKDLWEGSVRTVTINAIERNAEARKCCISHYGAKCFVCGFSFVEKYGPSLDGFIHVHHLRLLSQVNEKYKVDPIADLVPICPNCHAAIHSVNPPYSPNQLRAMLQER